MDSLHNKNTEGIDWCKAHSNILCWPVREKKLLHQYSDQYIDDKIWHLIFPRQLYEMTGKELNLRAELYNITFAKCIHPNGHFGYIFKYGENVDTKEFSPCGTCSAGGLYFTLERMIENYYTYGQIIVEITVDDDARVWIEDGKMKADKINIVSTIKHISFCMKSLHINISCCHMRKKKLCAQSHDNKLWENIFPRAGIEINGYDLNRRGRYHDVTFAKCITSVENTKRMFKCGENVAKEFCPRGLCIPGGIYFTLECLIFRYKECGDTIVEITVNDNARVWIENEKMKADKINIVGIIPENNLEYCSIL